MPMEDPATRKAALDARRRKQLRHDQRAGPRIAELRAEDLGWREIARTLDAEGIPTPRGGGSWHPEQARRVAARWMHPQATDKRPQGQAWPWGLLQRLLWWR